MGRSKLKQKVATPFLNDPSQSITDTYTAPLPEMRGLPIAAEYNYNGRLPGLLEDQFGPGREATPLFRLEEARRKKTTIIIFPTYVYYPW